MPNINDITQAALKQLTIFTSNIANNPNMLETINAQIANMHYWINEHAKLQQVISYHSQTLLTNSQNIDVKKNELINLIANSCDNGMKILQITSLGYEILLFKTIALLKNTLEQDLTNTALTATLQSNIETLLYYSAQDSSRLQNIQALILNAFYINESWLIENLTYSNFRFNPDDIHFKQAIHLARSQQNHYLAEKLTIFILHVYNIKKITLSIIDIKRKNLQDSTQKISNNASEQQENKHNILRSYAKLLLDICNYTFENPAPNESVTTSHLQAYIGKLSLFLQQQSKLDSDSVLYYTIAHSALFLKEYWIIQAINDLGYNLPDDPKFSNLKLIVPATQRPVEQLNKAEATNVLTNQQESNKNLSQKKAKYITKLIPSLIPEHKPDLKISAKPAIEHTAETIATSVDTSKQAIFFSAAQPSANLEQQPIVVAEKSSNTIAKDMLIQTDKDSKQSPSKSLSVKSKTKSKAKKFKPQTSLEQKRKQILAQEISEEQALEDFIQYTKSQEELLLKSLPADQYFIKIIEEFKFTLVNKNLELNREHYDILHTKLKNMVIIKNNSNLASFLTEINLNMRTYCILLELAVDKDVKTAILQQLILDKFNAQYYPLSFIFNIAHTSKSLADKSIFKKIVEKNATYSNIDSTENALHHHMRHIPDDLEILELILKKYNTKEKPGILHPTNIHNQNFMHILVQNESNEKIINTLSYLLSKYKNEEYINSAMMLKDNNYKTPINSLELRENYSQDALDLAITIVAAIIFNLARSQTQEHYINTHEIKDIFGNKQLNSNIVELFNNNNFSHMQKIVDTRIKHREDIFNGYFSILRINGIDIFKHSEDHIQSMLQIFGDNEFITIKINDQLLLHAIIELEQKNNYFESINIIKESKNFKNALSNQPITEAPVWKKIEHSLKSDNHNIPNALLENIKAYIKEHTLDIYAHKSYHPTMLEKFIAYRSITGIKFWCEHLNGKVMHDNIVLYITEKYGAQLPGKNQLEAQVLKCLLNYHNDKKETLNLSQNDDDLLRYTTTQRKHLEMMQVLIDYGFSVTRLYTNKKVSFLSLVIDEYAKNRIPSETIINILELCFQAIHQDNLAATLNHLDGYNSTCLDHLISSLSNNNNDKTIEIINLLIKNGLDIFKNKDINNSSCQIIVKLDNIPITNYIFGLMQQINSPLFLKIMNKKNEDGKTILDVLTSLPDISKLGSTIILLKSFGAKLSTELKITPSLRA